MPAPHSSSWHYALGVLPLCMVLNTAVGVTPPDVANPSSVPGPQTSLPLAGPAQATPSLPLPAAPAPTPAAETRHLLLVEPMSAEWEARLVPSLLQSLKKIAPYEASKSEAAAALEVVRNIPNRLSLMRRSSLNAAGGDGGLEVLEIGPAACLALIVREDAPWQTYGDLNYPPSRPLRIEAVSPGALSDLKRLLGAYPLAVETSLLIRPTHIAVQRLSAGETDMVALDVPRRGASEAPAEVVSFALSRQARPLQLPQNLTDMDKGGRQVGEIILAKGWFWEAPVISQTLCDPFVLAMPAAGADQFIHTLYSGMADTAEVTPVNGGSEPAMAEAAHPPSAPAEGTDLWTRLKAAFYRLLTAVGIHWQ